MFFIIAAFTVEPCVPPSKNMNLNYSMMHPDYTIRKMSKQSSYTVKYKLLQWGDTPVSPWIRLE